MSVKRIAPGQTFTLSGTLAASDTLIGLSGAPAAQILVSGAAANSGTIKLAGAHAPAAQGTTLRDTGLLTNNGGLYIGGATQAGYGALLEIVGTLTNNATLFDQGGTNGAGGQIAVGGGTLLNNGLITIDAGNIAGGDGATLSVAGVLINTTTGTIDINAAKGFGSTYSAGNGALVTVSGTLTNNGAINLYDPSKSGRYVLPATLSIAGVLQNNASIDVGQFVIGTAGAVLAVSGTATNANTITVAAGRGGYDRHGYRSTLAVSGTLINEGQLTLQGGGQQSKFNPAGLGALLTVTGSLDNEGNLLLGRGGSQYNSFLTGGTVMDAGVLTNVGTMTVQSSGELLVTGSMVNTGELMAQGSADRFYEEVTYGGVGGLINVTGSLTNSGSLSLGGGLAILLGYGDPQRGSGGRLLLTGTASNSGVITLGGGEGTPSTGKGYSYDFGRGASITITTGYVPGGLSNYGTIALGSGGASSYGPAGTGATLIDAGVLTNSDLILLAAGNGTRAGTLDITSTGKFLNSGTVQGGGVVLNQGVLYESGHSNILGGTLINDGTLQTSLYGRGTVDSAIAADPGKTGLLVIAQNSTLQLGGPIAASQTILFGAAREQLNLADAIAFSGTLSGIVAGDTIDFVKTDVISATTTGDVLAIGLSTGSTLDLALAAPLNGLSLTLQSDKQGGTDLLFVSAPHH